MSRRSSFHRGIVHLTHETILHDRGWNKVMDEISKLGNSFTKVGFPDEAKPQAGTIRGSGHSSVVDMSELVTIAAVHEFGAPRVKVPARPFMSTAFDENLQSLNRIKENEVNKILSKRSTVKESLDKIGLWFAAKIKRKITTLKYPPLKLATIRRKRSQNPLIDTGQMRASVTHVVKIRRVPLSMVEI